VLLVLEQFSTGKGQMAFRVIMCVWRLEVGNFNIRMIVAEEIKRVPYMGIWSSQVQDKSESQ